MSPFGMKIDFGLKDFSKKGWPMKMTKVPGLFAFSIGIVLLTTGWSADVARLLDLKCLIGEGFSENRIFKGICVDSIFVYPSMKLRSHRIHSFDYA